MNDIINNNNRSSADGKKTKLESQIEALQAQERQINQQLKFWETKAKKANNLANCLETAEKFGKQFLNEAIENEKTKEQPDNWWLERLLENKVEFTFKFALGIETFTQLVNEKIERQVRVLQTQLESIQNQIQHQERKFARLQARRQGKVLLECEYRKSLGCFGDYQCENCQVNYSAPQSSNQLEGGAY